MIIPNKKLENWVFLAQIFYEAEYNSKVCQMTNTFQEKIHTTLFYLFNFSYGECSQSYLLSTTGECAATISRTLIIFTI